MEASSPHASNKALGAFLRARREAIAPEDAGLPAGARRRTPGLRREEAAQLSAVSTTWYTWLEQGRPVSASPAALARLARGLRMSPAERAYFFDLAGKRDPDWSHAAPEDPPAPLLASVHAISGPAYILDRLWTARSWNAAAERLFTGWLDRPETPNLLRYVFCAPEARRLIVDWEDRARRVAAEFRAATPGPAAAPDRDALIAGLRRDSPDFAEFWAAHGVLEREGGARSFNHPTDGLQRYQQVSLNIASWPDFRLTMLILEGGEMD